MMVYQWCLIVLLVISLAACRSASPPVMPTPAAESAPTLTPASLPAMPTDAPESTPTPAPPVETYLGETPPGAEPALFRPGSVSTGAIELSLALHPNQQELYFTRLESGQATLMVSHQIGDGWTTPEPASFSGEYDDVNPFVSADGQKLYFSSKRPAAGNGTPDEHYRIWVVAREGDGWANPTRLALPLESANGESSPSLTRAGTLYYVADYPELGGNGLYRAPLVNGTYQTPEKMAVLVDSGDIVEVEPFIAPDESFVLFYSAGRPDNLMPNSKTGDIYIAFRDSQGQWSTPQNVGAPVSSSAEESTPTLSPDGHYLFFASNRTAGQRFPDLYWVEAAGLSTLKTEAETPAASGGLLAFYSDRDGNPEIYTMHADGSTVTRLTHDPGSDDSPALAPDGAHIAFLTARHDSNPQFPDLKYEIYVMDSDGSNPRRLTETEAAEDHPAWAPDGSKISFDADYDGDGFYEIYTMNADGTDVIRLTANAANDQFADWSPDGTQIAFASDRHGHWDIFVMDADGGHQRALTDSPNWELFPAWSPDGTQIAYNGLVPRSRNTDVFVMNADGSNVRQLTAARGFDENPVWSPDGRLIAFQTDRDGHFELYVMAPDGSQQRPLAAHPADELWPSWGLAPAPSVALTLEKSAQDLGLRETFEAALGDLDGDGDLDAIFANPMRNYGAVWLNDGRGIFADTDQQLTQYGHGVKLADFDGDGDLDAVMVCHQNSAATQVYLNDGTGVFTATGQDFGDARISAADVNVLDLNGDGAMDIHILYYSDSGVPDQVYLNDGSATFRDSGLLLDEDFIAWGDLDGDGDVDYFGKHWGAGYGMRRNDGSGQFILGWQMADRQASVGDVVLADFDGDGDLDTLISNGFRDTGSQPARLLWNDGSGAFTASGLRLNETMGAHFAVGDLDLDGRWDVVVTNMDRPNEVWLKRGEQFVDSGLRLGSPTEMSGRPTLGDLDGDGDLDVIIGRFRGGAEIWFNKDSFDTSSLLNRMKYEPIGVRRT